MGGSSSKPKESPEVKQMRQHQLMELEEEDERLAQQRAAVRRGRLGMRQLLSGGRRGILDEEQALAAVGGSRRGSGTSGGGRRGGGSTSGGGSGGGGGTSVGSGGNVGGSTLVP